MTWSTRLLGIAPPLTAKSYVRIRELFYIDVRYSTQIGPAAEVPWSSVGLPIGSNSLGCGPLILKPMAVYESPLKESESAASNQNDLNDGAYNAKMYLIALSGGTN